MYKVGTFVKKPIGDIQSLYYRVPYEIADLKMEITSEENVRASQYFQISKSRYGAPQITEIPFRLPLIREHIDKNSFKIAIITVCSRLIGKPQQSLTYKKR